MYTRVCPSGQNKQAIFQQSLSDKVIYHSVTVPGRLESKACQPKASTSVSEKSVNGGNYCFFFLAFSIYVLPKVPVHFLVCVLGQTFCIAAVFYLNSKCWLTSEFETKSCCPPTSWPDSGSLPEKDDMQSCLFIGVTIGRGSQNEQLETRISVQIVGSLSASNWLYLCCCPTRNAPDVLPGNETTGWLSTSLPPAHIRWLLGGLPAVPVFCPTSRGTAQGESALLDRSVLLTRGVGWGARVDGYRLMRQREDWMQGVDYRQGMGEDGVGGLHRDDGSREDPCPPKLAWKQPFYFRKLSCGKGSPPWQAASVTWWHTHTCTHPSGQGDGRLWVVHF